MLWLATMAAVAGWTAAGVWMALWWRQRRHVRIAWRVASQAVAERGLGSGGWRVGAGERVATRMLARRRAGEGVAVVLVGGEPTVESVEALAWLN